MQKWYNFYQSQCWYRNTYLVNNHYDIEELNNIYNSGCHFTCMAMMLNVSAAVLASELSKSYYFKKDETGLVWDNNKPNKKGDSIFIPFLYDQQGIIENITITLLDTAVKNDIVSASQFIEEKHREGLHLICGDSSHSLLISGEVDGTYFVWDPDTSWDDETKLIENNLKGKHSLQWLYSNYSVKEKLEFWVYSVEICT